ncbi:Egd1p [Sugiyamaella lignohabitans]|uniref:Nascent polypeptide-associated complex subunit beta n=1 Tax=Sugiyamaella lignohabitans TaxID=796027 RepID=A0A161HKE4_9ASCO|nr:Egd1p [Sugiyamaella lignohabitans]ANB12128.1 Egd1p [Sugiyamaella lignohabitans]
MDADKLARLQKSVRIGGKGTPRRKVKRTAKNTEGDDKKLQAALQKVQVQPITGIESVNMFKDDGTVLHFPRASVQASVPSNTFAITGNPVEKTMSEMLPEVLSSMGPESLEQLRQLTEQLKAGTGAKEAEDDDIPELVEGENFEDRVD